MYAPQGGSCGVFFCLSVLCHNHAGIVKVRKKGTMNFYYFDPEMEALERLIATLQLAKEISGALPDRTNENN